MSEPTPEMIEAGAKYLNESGSGKSGDIAEGTYLAMRGVEAPAIVPDELVKAAARATDLLHDAVRSHVDEGWKFAAGSAVKELRAALAIPRRTEADIRADEWERLAKLADAESADEATYEGIAGIEWGWLDIAEWLRSQGGEDE